MFKVLATALLLSVAACTGEGISPAPAPVAVDAGPACHDTDPDTCLGNVVVSCDAKGNPTMGACPYACVDGEGCTGVCVPGDTKTDCNGLHTCTSVGTWDPIGAACPVAPACVTPSPAGCVAEVGIDGVLYCCDAVAVFP